ncbi:hypothetical protein C5C31_10165 [Rathayibacter rathayi]|uniref:Uncharacterized protein n=1 Tax=Rathayibacter rathayi TaxID=33887 RepID=A0ABD6WA07_RATRA|nr:hypothetical protein [Rathayibacter rathayi]AZZ48475.1 hypothetical protein C1O28_04070 [Rathayibacter rathayi]MWV74391.1 hypothetical protein [Rathayibacter rathayi NCPPB 2980 = VKM Ac-1601]PPF14850.1 hypothetical protein C5C04_05405 [Rathayibacter rathayi]PPF50073.1 hypothetical protein C5C08_05865 [Rathayibacter rathayi]PPF80677.1 hypothetical protein C5C14_05715 [Rathayibacter rathayi]
MSTSSDGAPGRQGPPAPRAAGAAPSRRSIRTAAEAGARRAAAVTGGRRSSTGGARTETSRTNAISAGAVVRRYGAGIAAILLAALAVPISFFVWYALISLGAYPGDQAVSDLLVGVLYAALVHAVLLTGILLAVSSIRARRREKRPPIAGWIGVVVNVLMLVYWELLVSPWLVVLWNRATGS